MKVTSLLRIYSPSKMSFHYFEAAGHATVYNKFRPRPPEELVKRIINFLVEKVSHRRIKMGIYLHSIDLLQE